MEEDVTQYFQEDDRANQNSEHSVIGLHRGAFIQDF